MLLYYYFIAQIPYFGMISTLLGIIILVFSFIIHNQYQNQLEQIKYLFKAPGTTRCEKIKENILHIGFFSVSVTLIFVPVEGSSFKDYNHYFFIGLLLIIFLAKLFEFKYKFYYFTDSFITEPGISLKKIDWRSVKNIHFKDENKFILDFHNGKIVQFDLDVYAINTHKDLIIDFLVTKTSNNLQKTS